MSVDEIKIILENEDMSGNYNVPFVLEAGNLDIEMVIDFGEYLNDVRTEPVSLEYFCCVRIDGEWESYDIIFDDVILDVPDIEAEMFRVLSKYAEEKGLSFFSDKNVGRCEMQTCERCKNSSLTLRMSFFNTQMICPACIKTEKAHAGYQEAHDTETEAVRQGDYNFPGIGLPEDLARRYPHAHLKGHEENGENE